LRGKGCILAKACPAERKKKDWEGENYTRGVPKKDQFLLQEDKKEEGVAGSNTFKVRLGKRIASAGGKRDNTKKKNQGGKKKEI